MKTNYTQITGLLLILLLFSQCKKEDEFLAAKRNQSYIVPATLDDFDKLLANDFVFNRTTDPSIGHVSSDEYFITTEIFKATPLNTSRNLYTWAKDIYQSETYGDIDWNAPYAQVYYANVILEGLDKLKPSSVEQVRYNKIKGSALFFRCWAFYSLLQVYAMPYDSNTSGRDLGIVLRLSSDFNIQTGRASVKQCYDKIMGDLELALQLLPEQTLQKTQPCQLAALGLFSRLYLVMGNFQKAYESADAYLKKNAILTDYNTLVSQTGSIHTGFLSEDIFHTSMNTTYAIGRRNTALIAADFVAGYHNNDLRKTLFFVPKSGNYNFKGSYDYSGYPYSGIATDELFLNRAECLARAGQTEAAMTDLNTLLATRWKKGATYNSLTATSADDALQQVLKERRKELYFRGTRWTDIRRLNKEGRFPVTMTRNINGQIYTLLPNDKRYALPIPDSEIQTNGIKQNER